MYELPVYLFWGFLESGKTTLIKDTLSQDYFNDGERTMILTFEEGEVEYDKALLKKSRTIMEVVEEEEEFTPSYLMELEKKNKQAQSQQKDWNNKIRTEINKR